MTVNITRSRKAASLALASALAISLAACSDETEESTDNSSSESADGGEDNTDGGDTEEGGEGSGASGTLEGSGASSMQNAQQAWRDNFANDTGITVNYNPTGSGTGREQFIAGQVSFAGTDSKLSEEELSAATDRCNGSEVLELPLYISPIAIAYNLPGVDDLNLSASNIAKIFDGQITSWNDDAIKEDNPDIELPDLPIVPINRADDSGTTENFTEYLVEAAGDDWSYEPSDVFPKSGTQSAEKTSGVVTLAQSTEGAITYADASQIGDLGAANVEVAGDFLPYSPDAAAAIVDNSEPSADATDHILTVDLVRDGSVADAYPVVLISYVVACTEYSDTNEASLVKDYLSYMASAEGQDIATENNGGNAPISDDLRGKVETAIADIVTE